MTVIIIAAGDGRRWDGYRGVPKHLVEVDGERLLDRTARQFPGALVVAPDDPRYDTPYTVRVAGNHNPQHHDADKFLSSRHLWNPDGRTVILYGDVWFSDEAVRIVTQHPDRGIVFFGRGFKSLVTGTPWGELFAVSLYPEDHDEAEAALLELVRLYDARRLRRIGGWEWYHKLQGLPLEPRQHRIAGNFIEISPSFTDDFDYAKDLIRWERRRREWFNANRNEPDTGLSERILGQ